MSYNIFDSETPATNSAGSFNLGTRFYSGVAGAVNGVRFYKFANMTEAHIGTLYDNAGTQLAQITFAGESASGWQYMAFASPYTIAAQTPYVVACSFPGHYAQTANYFTTIGKYAIFTNPLYCPVTSGRSLAWGGAPAFPTGTTETCYFVDVDFTPTSAWSAPAGIRSFIGKQWIVGALQGITLGGPTSMIQDNGFMRHMQTGVREELVDGYPSPPCLALDYPGFWRFRWQVVVGTQTISVYAKQVSNVAGKRPSMVVKANAALGVVADVSGSAGSSAGWVKIGPLSVTATTAGVLWVELHNNDTDTFYSPAFFDNLGP